MKKFGLFFLVMNIFLLCGCSRQETLNDSSTEIVDTQSVETEITEQKNEEVNVDVTGHVPEWMAPYVALEQCSETIYLDGESTVFTVENGHLIFPESNLMIVSKEIAGDERKGITDNKQLITEVLDLLKEETILEESDTMNPDSKYINMDFDMVFLTVEGKYALMQFDLFDDSRMKIDITSENNESPVSFWIQSESIAGKIKEICDFAKYELSSCNEIQSIEIYNMENQVYKLSDEELEHFKNIVANLNTETMLCSGPYDIRIVGTSSDETISMKWCNDGCGILAIAGYCYIVEEDDCQWIQERIGKCR